MGDKTEIDADRPPIWSESELPDDVRDKLIGEVLAKIGDDRACELCDAKSWGIDTRLVVLTPIAVRQRAFTRFDEKGAPHLQMTCQNCGNTKLLQATFFETLKDLIGRKDD